MPFQIAAHEAIFVNLEFERGGAGFLDRRQSELLGPEGKCGSESGRSVAEIQS